MAWTSCFRDMYVPLMAGSIDGTDEFPHDHGIFRAMQAKYKPNPITVTGKRKNTLFFARLHHLTEEDKLREIFEQFGDLVKCNIVRDIITGFSRCYGFVEFENERDAEDAHRKCNGMMVDDSRIVVEYESERTLKGWVPRRLGGGFGGKKESGQLRFGGRDRPFKRPILPGSTDFMYLAKEETRDKSNRPSRDVRIMEEGGRDRRRQSRDRKRDRSRDRRRERSRDR